MSGWISIKGARQHNLKNIDVDLPKNKLVVITGPSGAGKSSLAFDTLYAEGQRRYVESLSPSARQFLTQLEKPDVDALEGLGPAIAIEQRVTASSPRSTVGTVSDIHDYLRLLFARVGKPHCYHCGLAIRGWSVQDLVDEVVKTEGYKRLIIGAPQTYDPKMDFADTLERFLKDGFVRVRLNGEIHLLEDEIPPPRKKAKSADVQLDLVVDRLSLAKPDLQRLTEAIEQAFHFGGGLARLIFMGEDSESEIIYSRMPRCPKCGITYPEPHPRIFSFNSPYGACTDCQGLGVEDSIDLDLVVPDSQKTLADGAIVPWEKKSSVAFHQMLEQVAQHYGFSIFDPFESLTQKHQNVILQGSGKEVLEFSYVGEDSSYQYSKPFEGVIPNLERRYRETESASVRDEIRRYMRGRVCRTCDGQRLCLESLHYLVDGRSIAAVSALPLKEAQTWAGELALEPMEMEIAAKLIEEIARRSGFLINVGLHYLTLNRTMDTLSSGEAQRIVLATQIGSALTGVIYILDEPTIGLHQRDTERLLGTLTELRDAENTVVVVEHDKETMEHADYLIEIGPHAGEAGGQLVAAGTPEEVKKVAGSLTGAYLAGTRDIAVPATRRKQTWQRLSLSKANLHNLKNVEIDIPLGLFVCVTGVSGSGKSSLILDTLRPVLTQKLRTHSPRDVPKVDIEGVEYLDRVIHVDQAPIGKTSRSNPGTYLGIFNQIRELFSGLPESRARGYLPRRFSFNVSGGRCEACQGDGVKRIEMHFLPDVYIRCDICDGQRFNRDTLEIKYRGKNIADILEMTVSEVAFFFQAIPTIRGKLQAMLDVGMGYLRLGQAANTLSGGEAQRLKVARELGRRDAGRTLYILDEPTAGLHVEDVERLLGVLQKLVDAGNSIIVIEHNMEVIKCADYLIEMGPEGGVEGGYVVAKGTPEAVVKEAPDCPTARYLKGYLNLNRTASNTISTKKDSYLHNNRTNPS